MAVDKVKPLGLEETTDGSQTVPFPTEMNPNQDYAAVKGISFENLDTYRFEKLQGAILEAYPDGSVKVTYTSNNPTLIEYFITASQITANRIASNTITYTSNDPATEILRIYSTTDGTTVVRTITKTYTYTSHNLQSYTEVTT